jgi:hypothetical protein
MWHEGLNKDKASRMKHQTCYTCRDKGHLSKDCPKAQTFIHKAVNNNKSHLEPKNDTSTIKMISSSCHSPCAIWVPKYLLTNLEEPNKAWVPKQAWSTCRWLEMHWKLDNQQEDGIIATLSSAWTLVQFLTQCNLKNKISAYPYTWYWLKSLYLVLLQTKDIILQAFVIYFFMPYDALNGSLVEQCASP